MKRFLSILIVLCGLSPAFAANEVQFDNGTTGTGQTLYYVLSNSSYQVWNTTTGAWATYTETRSDFDNPMTEIGSGVDATGRYAGSLPAVTGALTWTVYDQGGGSPVHDDAVDVPIAAGGRGLDAQEIRDSLDLPATGGAASLDDRLPAALVAGKMDSTASVTLQPEDVNELANQLIAANATILTDIDQDPVAEPQVFRVIRKPSGLTADSKTIRVGSANLYGFEWRSVAAANRQIITVNSVAIASGTAGGITFGTPGRDNSIAKVRMTGVTAGDYTVSCNVTFYGGWSDTVIVPVKVVN
jgi:hypothetical protein